MSIDLSQFNHCHSTDPPLKRALVTHGEHKGRHGYIVGRWDHDYRKWTIRLADGSTGQGFEWVSLLPGQFKIVEVPRTLPATTSKQQPTKEVNHDQ